MADSSNFSNMSRLFSTAGQAPTQQGTGYTNLSRIAQANVGAGQQLGQKVATDIGSQIGGVKTQLQKQQEQFEAEKQKELGKLSTTEREAILGRFTGPTAGAGPSEEEVSKFGTFLAGQYKGPSGLTDTGALSSQASGIAKQTSAFTPSGTQELLRRSVGGDRYTAGQSRLDTLLMGKQAAEALKPAQREAAQLGQQITQAQAGAAEQAKAAETQARQFAEETKTKLGGAQTEIDTAVQAQLKAAQEAEKQRLAVLQGIEDINRGYGYERDEQGNIKYDSKGQPLKVYNSASSNLNDLQKIQAMEGILKGKVDQADLAKVFGAQGTAATKKAVEDALQGMYNKYAAFQSGSGVSPGPLFQNIGYGYGTGLNRNIAYALQGGGFASYLSPEISAYKQMAQDNALARQVEAGLYGNTSNLGGVSYQTNVGAESKLGSLPTSIIQSLLQKSALAQNAAQNVTEQGVASDVQRANYEALTRLLGKTVDQAKYRTNAEKYQAGKLVLDPTQI